MAIPGELITSQIVEKATGLKVTSIRRFTTGNHHYVYDVFLSDGRNVVARMTTPNERGAMSGALIWNERLRRLDLPLPTIYYSDLDSSFPFLIMERFVGNDLGYEIGKMKEEDLRALARQLMKFQRVVGGLPTAGRFGYATAPESAPAKNWIEVLSGSISRSRKRIQDVGFVGLDCLDKLDKLFSNCEKQLCTIQSIPFLHDITTKNVIVAGGKLSGIVDVDSLCYGDPLHQIALTKMALLSDGSDTGYIDFLLEEFGSYSKELLRLYTIECCIGFLSEIGQPFNGNVVTATVERKEKLESILRWL